MYCPVIWKDLNGCIFSLKTSTRHSPASEIMKAHFQDREEDTPGDGRTVDQNEAAESKQIEGQLFVQDEPSAFQKNVLYYIYWLPCKAALKPLLFLSLPWNTSTLASLTHVLLRGRTDHQLWWSLHMEPLKSLKWQKKLSVTTSFKAKIISQRKASH